jgi:hypothetical protein
MNILFWVENNFEFLMYLVVRIVVTLVPVVS